MEFYTKAKVLRGKSAMGPRCLTIGPSIMIKFCVKSSINFYAMRGV